MKKIKNGTLGNSAIASGLTLSIMSFLAYKFYNVGFIGEVHSEVFGVGVGLLVIGLVYKLFKIKLS